MGDNQTKFLTIHEALNVVKELGFQCSEIRMRRMARERELPFFKDGRRLYIARDQLVGYYDQRQERASRA